MNKEGLLLVAVTLGAVIVSRLQGGLGRNKVPWYRDAMLLLATPWLMGGLVYMLPLFVYREPLQMRHVAFICACLFMFFIGVMMVRTLWSAAPVRPRELQPRQQSNRVLWIVVIAGLLGQALALIGGVLSTRASLWDIVSGEVLAQMRLRNQYLAQGYSGSPFVRFNFLGAGGFVFLFMYAGGCVARATLRPAARRVMQWSAWSIGFMIVFNALFIRGGRMEVVLLCIGMLLSMLLDSERHVFGRLKRIFDSAKILWTVALMSFAVGTVVYMATGFTKNRIGTASAYAALEQYHRASPAREVELFTGNNEYMEFALLNVSYLPVPLTTFGYYFDLRESLFPGPFWGQYNFTGPVTFFMRRVGLREEQRTMQDIRRDATTDLRMRGYGENVWATILRDLAFDLGWWGALPAMALLGFVSQRLLLVAGRSRAGISMALAPLSALLLLMSLAHSLFVLENFAVAFYFCVFVAAIEAFGRLYGQTGRNSTTNALQPLSTAVGLRRSNVASSTESSLAR